MVKHFIKNDGENTNWELATVVIAFIEVEFVFVFVAIFVSVDFNFEDDVNFRVVCSWFGCCLYCFFFHVSFLWAVPFLHPVSVD